MEPTLLALTHPLAQIQDAFNAVQISGNIVGDLLFTGRGAGELPTASAVVEDLAFLLTQPFSPHPTWRERNAAGREQEASHRQQPGNQALCYLEGSCPSATPDAVLHFLRQSGVAIHRLKVQYDLGGVLRAGLIVDGLRVEHQDVLESDFGLSARLFPLLD